MNPYELLGVQTNATSEQIKNAYRFRAQKTHPDKRGGDAQQFKYLQEALALLSDDKKRAAFDRTGTSDQRFWHVEEDAAVMIANNFKTMLIDNDYEIMDYVEMMVAHFHDGCATLKKHQAKMEEEVCKMQMLCPKIICCHQDDNLLVQTLNHQIKKTEKSLNDCRLADAVGQTAIMLLEKYGIIHATEPLAENTVGFTALSVGVVHQR